MKKIKLKSSAWKQIFALSAFAIFSVSCNLGGASVSSSTTANTKSATLNWSASQGIITGYKIEQSTDNVNFTEVLAVGNATSATVTGLYPGSTYYFRVKAYNQGGNSASTSIASLAVPAAN